MPSPRSSSWFGAVAALVLSGCAVTNGGADSTESDEVVSAPWDSEAQVANTDGYKKTVLAYFDEHAVRGSFRSDHAKHHDTRQGSAVDIAYAIVRAKNEKGAIVVVNGRTESFSHYAELVYDLSRRGWSLYMLDHRGQGHSSRLLDYATVGDADYQKGHIDDFQEYVDDLGKFVDTVVRPDRQRAKGKGKLFALGHSLGGAVVTLYDEQHPDAFDAIALSSPMHKIQSSWFLLDVAKVGALFFPTHYAAGKGPRDDNEAFENNGLTNSRARFEAKRSIWNADPSTKVGGPTYGWVSESAEATEHLRHNAGKIHVPVLLLEAGADAVVAPEGQQAVCNAINAQAGDPSRCTLEVVPQSQHEGLIEVDAIRDHELDLVTAFFTEQSRN